LILDNLPPSLAAQRETLARCLEAMNQVMPLRAVYLFGSHARGDARPDSDVDLCIVAEGAARQLEASASYSDAIWDVLPRPAFTLIPIALERLCAEAATAGKSELFDALHEYLAEPPAQGEYQPLARKLSMTENALRVTARPSLAHGSATNEGIMLRALRPSLQRRQHRFHVAPE
jgi:predicted nucleotidyltransferase